MLFTEMQRRHQAQVDHPAYRFRPGYGNAPAYGYPPNQYPRGEPQHQPHQRVEPHQLQARHGNVPQQVQCVISMCECFLFTHGHSVMLGVNWKTSFSHFISCFSIYKQCERNTCQYKSASSLFYS